MILKGRKANLLMDFKGVVWVKDDAQVDHLHLKEADLMKLPSTLRRSSTFQSGGLVAH